MDNSFSGLEPDTWPEEIHLPGYCFHLWELSPDRQTESILAICFLEKSDAKVATQDWYSGGWYRVASCVPGCLCTMFDTYERFVSAAPKRWAQILDEASAEELEGVEAVRKRVAADRIKFGR